MARTLPLVERNKAEKIYRFINYIVDLGFSLLTIWFLFLTLLLLKYFILGTPINESYDQMTIANPIIERIFLLLLYSFLLFLVEFITKGRSLGKFLTGTKVVKTDGSDLSMMDLLKRNFIRIVPFDQLSFIGSKGFHDNFSDTAVVRMKNFEKAKNLEMDLEMIGVKENL